MFDFVKRMYLNGTYTDADLDTLVSKGRITEQQAEEIKSTKQV